LGVATVALTLSQYRVLILLGKGKEAAPALAEKLAATRASVTGVVDLTDEGRRRLELADAGVERRLREIAADRPDGAVAAFEGLGPWLQARNADRSARSSRAGRAGGAR